MIYVLIMALGTCVFVDLYIFRFDELTEQELIRYSFYWGPPILFGLLGLIGRQAARISNPLMFASVGTLIGIAALAGLIILAFLS
jgi:hypothetical protein